MTCIVALKHNRTVYMGADSAGVGGYALHLRKDPKIYRLDHMLIGFTTSFRMGQLLGNSLRVPDRHPKIEVYKWMCTDFIDAVRTCLKNGGYAKKENETEQGGTFLVAYEGRIFMVDSDYQVGEMMDDFTACGCGQDLALGAMFASHSNPDPRARIETALEAAERFSAGVRGPFLIESI